VVIRRVGIAVAAVLAVLVGTAAPASAAPELAVTVAEVRPGQVRLVAAVPDVSATHLPQVTVTTRSGQQLSTNVRLGQSDLVVPPTLRTVVIVLDTSQAMAGAGLEAAKAGLTAFARAVTADVAIGVVAAGAKPTVLLRPTRERAAVANALAGLRPAGGSAIYAAVRAAADLGTGANDRLLVVSSGRDSADGPGTVVRDLTAAGRRLDLVTVGAVPNTLSELRRLVTATGGLVQSAANVGGLNSTVTAAAATFSPLVTINVTIPPELANATETLTVTVGTAAGKVSKAMQVRFAPTSIPRVAGSTSKMPNLPVDPIVLLGLLVFGIMLVGALLALAGVGTSIRRRRLKQVEQFRLPARSPRGSGATFGPRAEGAFARAVSALMSQVRSSTSEQDSAQRGEGGGLTTVQPWVLRLGAAVVGAALFGLLGGLFGLLLGALIGWLVAMLYPHWLERRRRRAFAEQLPDALQLIVGSLRSGFSLSQAIEAVVQDSVPSPLTEELGRAMGEVRLGAELDDSLERAAQRVGNDDLTWAVMAIRIQRETGGNLAEVIETTVDTLRERDRLRRHVRALSAEGRLSAYILIALPFVLAGWLMLVRRDYLRTLWTTPAGLMMMAGAAVLMTVGVLWMVRWMKVEV
jgi:Flp pilus assembly protein TadB